MFKYFIALLLVWSVSLPMVACDACSCAAGGMSGGSFTFQTRDFVGLQLQHRSFFDNSTEGVPSRITTDQALVTGRYMPVPYLQIAGSMPWRYYKRDGQVFSGIGDATLLVQAVVWPIRKSATGISGRLAIGGGVKLPTGKYVSAEIGDNQLQVGTGSWDLILNMNYLQRIKAWGILLDATHQRNQMNRMAYRYGDAAAVNLRITRWIKLNGNESSVLQPEVGLSYATAAQDVDGHQLNSFSGGWECAGSAGLHMMQGNFYFGCTFSHPIRQRYAGGLLDAGARINLQVNYLFKQK